MTAYQNMNEVMVMVHMNQWNKWKEVNIVIFKSVHLDPNHVLRKHFPETRPANYNLRPRAHEFKLPLKDDRNFVPRLLFKDMY